MSDHKSARVCVYPCLTQKVSKHIYKWDNICVFASQTTHALIAPSNPPKKRFSSQHPSRTPPSITAILQTHPLYTTTTTTQQSRLHRCRFGPRPQNARRVKRSLCSGGRPAEWLQKPHEERLWLDSVRGLPAVRVFTLEPSRRTTISCIYCYSDKITVCMMLV